MHICTRLDDFKQNIDEPTVVEVCLEKFELGCLKNGLHACHPSLIVCVNLHHFHEVLMSIQTVNVVGNEGKKIAQK